MNKIVLIAVVLISMCQPAFAKKKTNVQAVANDSGVVVKVNGQTIVQAGSRGASVHVGDSMIDAIDSAFTDTGFCDEVVVSDGDDAIEVVDGGFDSRRMFDKVFDGGMAAGITAIVLIFLALPLLVIVGVIIIVWLYLRNRRKKQQQEYEFIRSLSENGQDVSQYLNRQRPTEAHRVVEYRTVDKDGKTTSSKVKVEKTPDERYNKGITNTIIGGAITFVCWFFHWADIFVMGGMILLAVGISQMITAKNAMREDNFRDSYSRNETPKDQQNNDPTPHS